MIMKIHWQLVIVGLFLLAGCTGRHVVVDPQETAGLNDTQWRISQEPSVKVNPKDMIEEQNDLDPVQ